MKSILIAFCLYLVNVSVSALTPYEASYMLSISGVKVGIDRRILTIEDGSYHYQSDARTTGIGKLVKDYKIAAKTILDIKDSGINSRSFTIKETINGDIEKDIKINLVNGELDPLSLFLVLPHEIQKNPTKTNFNFKVNDGKKVEQHYYQIIKSNNDNIIKIIEKNKNIEMHFSKNNDTLLTFFKNQKISLRIENVVFTKSLSNDKKQ